MAGYIFSLDNKTSLKNCLRSGVYSTNLTLPKNNIWKIHHEGTFTDYLSMKEGDNVYFFIDRKVYGIGELTNIKGDCKFLNYPSADIPIVPDYDALKEAMLLNKDKDNVKNRCVCIFKPAPYFFENGIDMDDILSSNPRSFRMLRAFWKLSFIKIDDEENKALKNILLKRNEKYILENKGRIQFDKSLQKEIENKINDNYLMGSGNILKYAANKTSIRHEMAIESGIVDTIANDENSTFGQWDYISHQVIASPFKPIDYMDKMDVFGYRFINGFDTISKYLIVEIKKGKANREAVNQVMKYVDWVNYAFGDYSMINAFLVAYEFDADTVAYKNEVCKRNYTLGRRPAVPEEWTNIKLIKYRYDSVAGKIHFEEVK
ncbi:hypothetical protein [Bacillus cytotoxicus]|uniref:hypothetical protein n=1 Tax=Bacillus cytotoxicus TaxID=580165 RepID=UPI003D7D8AC3